MEGQGVLFRKVKDKKQQKIVENKDVLDEKEGGARTFWQKNKTGQGLSRQKKIEGANTFSGA